MTANDLVDLLVRGTLVNVASGTLEDGAIAVDNGEIVALEARPAEREIDTAYVAPGLIDAHMHVESSIVTLPRYGEAVVPHGVTSVIHDPHEVANVLGEHGVRALLKDAEQTPLKARFAVPSSVPASVLQDSGATLDAEAVARLLDEEWVVALGEVMDVPGVLADDPDIHAKIDAARKHGLTVDGHAPRLCGHDLHEAARFLDTDHESITLAEAREKANVGIHLHLREGSSSRNLSDLVDLVGEVESRRLSLCTDDRDVSDLIDSGGVDHALRRAIELGVDPVTAVQLATVNTADRYGLSTGHLEPGAPADLVLLSDLETWSVEHVLVDGEVDPTQGSGTHASALATGTVDFDPVDPDNLAIEHAGDGPVKVRVLDAIGGLQTARTTADVPVIERDGTRVLDGNPRTDVCHLAVIERHGGPGNVGQGFVRGLGIDRGAIGSTVAHDAHNCVVTGASHDAMARVANHLRTIDGGIAVYLPNEGVTSLALPLAGLLSDAPLAEVRERFEAVQSAAREAGLDHEGGVMAVTFLALEVIPEYRLTNNGLVDVERGEHVDVVVSPE